jgi:hypothetical protein
MRLAWGARVSPEFRRKVVAIALDIACDPHELMACIAFETGRTFSPSVRNPNSSATGLIQFMAATARELGTTVEALAAMTAEEQLDKVAQYFAPFRGKLHTLSDVYMAILWPMAVGAPEDAVIFQPGSRQYFANRGLDVDHDGAVTKAEAVAKVAALLNEGLSIENSAEVDGVAAPIEDRDLSGVPPRVEEPTKEGKRMDPLTLISVFGPIISSLIPQVGKLFGTGEVAKRNQDTAKLVLDTVVQATGTPNVQAAVEAMQSDPAKLQAATQAVLTEPKITALLEIGGGVAAARENDAHTMQNDKPFYKTSAVFWVSVMLVPMVMWYVGSSIVGGIDIPPDWPWYAQLPLKLFGVAWDAGAKVGLANLVVGLVLGGICGVYYGISVTQQKQNGASEQRAP